MERSKLKHTQEQRALYLEMIDQVSEKWMRVFKGMVENEEEKLHTHYWHLFTEIWRSKKPIKTKDALTLMKTVKSPQTAMKYLNAAVEAKLLEKNTSEQDSRVQNIGLSATMKSRMDVFFDAVIDELRETALAVDGKRK